MQFHVLIHGTDKNGAAEKVNQLLATARITPELLHQPGPGKPLVIKRRFNKAQASSLRDRLVGLGLESSILPLQPGSPASTSATLKRVSQQIQALFKQPSASQVEAATRFSAIQAWVLCGRSMLRPLLEVASLLAVSALLVTALAWLTIAAFRYSFLLGLLVVPCFLAILINCIALVAFFLWPRREPAPVRHTVSNQDDPRLMMFAAVICQMLKAPQPTAISLNLDPNVRAGLFREPSGRLRVSLDVPVPLLYSLNLAELASLIAGECGRLADTTSHTPSLLAEKTRNYLRGYMEQELDLTPLKHAASNLSAPLTAEILRKAIDVLEKGEKWRMHRVSQHLHRFDRIMANSQPSKRSRDLFWGAPAGHLETKVEQIAQARRDYMQEECSDGRIKDQLLIDQVAAAIAADAAVSSSPIPDSSLLQTQTPAHSLIKGLSERDKALSQLMYESLGLNLQRFSLRNRDEVLKRRQQNEHYREVAEQYFSGWFRPRQFWQIPLVTAHRTETLRSLNRCINQLRRLAPERNDLIAQQESLHQQIVELQAAQKISTGGATFKLVHNLSSSSDLASTLKARETRLRECNEELFHQNSIMGERLLLGLTLAQQRGAKIEGVVTALRCLAKLRHRLDKLQLTLDELDIVKAHRKGMIGNVFATYQRELNRAIDTEYQFLARQLEKCPYGFCEPGVTNLGQLLSLRIQQRGSRRTGEQARILLAVINEAHEKISQRAAGIAARMERDYQIEKIRRLPDTMSPASVNTRTKNSA